MIDLYSRKPINEKADIWALGVLLYKLAYFKMPFEEYPMAIVNAKLSFPATPRYSKDLQGLIGLLLNTFYSLRYLTFFLFVSIQTAFILETDPVKRPDIWELMDKLCKVRVCPYPLKVSIFFILSHMHISHCLSQRHPQPRDGVSIEDLVPGAAAAKGFFHILIRLICSDAPLYS